MKSNKRTVYILINIGIVIFVVATTVAEWGDLSMLYGKVRDYVADRFFTEIVHRTPLTDVTTATTPDLAERLVTTSANISQCAPVGIKKRAQLISESDVLTAEQKSLLARKEAIDNMDRLLPSYKTAVEAFNKDALDFNTRMTAEKSEIQSYNAAVSAYNTCAGVSTSQ